MGGCSFSRRFYGVRNNIARRAERTPTKTLAVLSKEPMKLPLPEYRQRVESYFELEYSDTPLQQVLVGLPDKYARKADKVIELHHQLKKPPSDAAGYAMRLLRGPCRSLIAGQEEC
jgi:hypothetical protein